MEQTHAGCQQLFTRAQPSAKFWKLLQFPLIRILLVGLFFLPFLAFHNTIVADLIVAAPEPKRSFLHYGDSILSVVVILLLYALYVRWVEKRKAVELSGEGAIAELGVGWLISSGIVVGMVVLMWMAGYYKIADTGSGKALVDAIFVFGIGALVQVLLFRLIIFRLLEEFVGTWVALVSVSATFGFAHLGNENATVWAAVALAAADVIMIAPFVLTRRLWMAWGLHWSWNFMQDGVFGMPNSGITELPSWIVAAIGGPHWLTGGRFGIEASVIVVIVSLAVGLLMLKIAIERDQILSPVWRRRRSQTA